MARLVQSVLAMVALVGFSQAFNISEFKSISKDKGVLEDWIKLEPNNGHSDADDFGLVYGKDKLYMISRRNKTALSGGIVSMLDKNGTWKHDAFDKLDDDLELDGILFALDGRLHMLSAGEKNNSIVFGKLFAWDEVNAKWNKIALDIPDKDNVFQKLTRSPRKFVSINVPDQEGKIAYIVSTDHDLANKDSETSFSKLELMTDNTTGMPTASLKFIMRSTLETGKAVIASSLKDDRLYALVVTFPMDNTTIAANISIDYSIDLRNGSKSDGVKFENASLPIVDYTAISSRIFQAGKDMVLFLGPHMEKDAEHVTRHVWDLDLSSMKFQDVDAVFLNFLVRVFAIDQKDMRLLTAHPKKGAFAATINV